jgi:hypothetical protein
MEKTWSWSGSLVETLLDESKQEWEFQFE